MRRKPTAGIQIEEQREVGQHAARRSQIQLADHLGIEAASVALVGDGGVGVAVGQHDAARAEPGLDALDDVLPPGGQEQEHLGQRIGTALEEPAHTLAERCAIRLACLLDGMALAFQPARQPEHLGGLARALDPFECNEHSPHVNASGRESRNCSTVPGAHQRWPSSRARLRDASDIRAPDQRGARMATHHRRPRWPRQEAP